MYDLGDSYELDGMNVWNWNVPANLENGIQSVDVKFATSLNGTFGSTDETDTGWGTANTMTFAQAPGTTDYTSETISFSQVSAQYVLFDVNSNHGGTRTGLVEVRFTAIPEPASLGLFALVGGLLWFVRRKVHA